MLEDLPTRGRNEAKHEASGSAPKTESVSSPFGNVGPCETCNGFTWAPWHTAHATEYAAVYNLEFIQLRTQSTDYSWGVRNGQ
jgi:hypothetical protein